MGTFQSQHILCSTLIPRGEPTDTPHQHPHLRSAGGVLSLETVPEDRLSDMRLGSWKPPSTHGETMSCAHLLPLILPPRAKNGRDQTKRWGKATFTLGSRREAGTHCKQTLPCLNETQSVTRKGELHPGSRGPILGDARRDP